MFGKIGKILKKTIIDPIDKAVVKPIDKAIIKPIDKAIIKPIDKAIIQPIIKPIDKAIIQPIDKAIVEPIREVTDKDFALRHERKQIEAIEKRIAKLRPEFFQSQQDLAVAQSEYERVSEDFKTAYGSAIYKKNIRRTPTGIVSYDPTAGLPDVVKAVHDGSRYILNAASLGLSEAVFNKEEIPRERSFLKNKISGLSRESQQLTHAVKQIRQAEDQFKAATEAIKAEHAELGADVTASDVHVISARETAQIEIVRRLLSEAVSHKDIAEITGFAPELVAEVSQNSISRKDA